MANLRDIRRRIASVKNTQQITSAMKMVSAAKLRKAHDAIEAARPYAARMRSTLEEVAGAGGSEHPLFEVREHVRAVEFVVIASDRGLAGAFNNGLLKYADGLLRERAAQVESLSLTLVGKRSGDYYRRRRREQIRFAAPTGNNITYAQAAEIAGTLSQRFAEGLVDEVVLVYNEFVSTLNQTPRSVKLLPFAPAAVEDTSEEKLPYEIEPSADVLLATLVPKAVETEIFRALLENQAGEHAARMTAMEGATKNTEELIDRLTLDYNRARQAAITRELVEIVTGAQALD